MSRRISYASEQSLDFEQVPVGSALRTRGSQKRKQKFGVRVVTPRAVGSRLSVPRVSVATTASNAESLQFVEMATPSNRNRSSASGASRRSSHAGGSDAESLVFQAASDVPAPNARVLGVHQVDQDYASSTQASLQFEETGAIPLPVELDGSSDGSIAPVEVDPSARAGPSAAHESPPRTSVTASDRESIALVEVDATASCMPRFASDGTIPVELPEQTTAATSIFPVELHERQTTAATSIFPVELHERQTTAATSLFPVEVGGSAQCKRSNPSSPSDMESIVPVEVPATAVSVALSNPAHRLLDPLRFEETSPVRATIMSDDGSILPLPVELDDSVRSLPLQAAASEGGSVLPLPVELDGSARSIPLPEHSTAEVDAPATPGPRGVHGTPSPPRVEQTGQTTPSDGESLVAVEVDASVPSVHLVPPPPSSPPTSVPNVLATAEDKPAPERLTSRQYSPPALQQQTLRRTLSDGPARGRRRSRGASIGWRGKRTAVASKNVESTPRIQKGTPLPPPPKAAPPAPRSNDPAAYERPTHFARLREIDQRRTGEAKNAAAAAGHGDSTSWMGGDTWGILQRGLFPIPQPVDKDERRRCGRQFDGVGSKFMQWYGDTWGIL
eukprot:Hpha_TRINITY_DN13613_c0_g2::TRINITY_DN13613_c0_g2_i1::g.122575::m.122575